MLYDKVVGRRYVWADNDLIRVGHHFILECRDNSNVVVQSADRTRPIGYMWDQYIGKNAWNRLFGQEKEE